MLEIAFPRICGDDSKRDSSAASNGWGTSASKVIPCCASCWWKQLRRRYVTIQSGDDDTYIWRASGIAHCQSGDGPQTRVRLYWMCRKEWSYQQVCQFGSHAGSSQRPMGEVDHRYLIGRHRSLTNVREFEVVT